MGQKLNKQVLMIDMDESLSIFYDTTFFQDGIVSKKKIQVPKRVSTNQKLYDWSLSYRRRLKEIQRFVKVTKLLTSKQIKIF